MPILSTDILVKQSGTENLGGGISASDVSLALHGLFDVVLGAESLVGMVDYRCVYVKNAHPTLTLFAATAFISSNTPSSGTTVDIGVGTSVIDGTEQTVANENAAPSGVSFGAPSTYGTGYNLGDLAPGQHRAIWVRRTVTAGAAAYNDDGATFAIQGDSAA